MTASVTLQWGDPEDAANFLSIRADYKRDGWLPDVFWEELLRLVGDSEVVKDSSEEERDG
jgi:hypothetical protein